MADENPQSNQKSTLALLTIREMTVLYGLDRTTIMRRIKSGELKAVRKPGSKGRNAPLFVIDPGWQQVSLTDTAKHGKAFEVDDVHILTGIEVAQILGVIPRTVRKMSEEGRLGFVRTGKCGRSHRRYSIADVRKALVTKQKGSFQIKRPNRKATREAVLKWAKERLAKELSEAQNCPKPPESHAQ